MSHDSSRAPRHGAPPSPFHAYREGRLESGGVSLADVADKFDTPTYVYAPASIDAR
jgi:diaminopimelate decarboxylase